MTEPQLQRLTAEWQKILRLQDWDVHTETVRDRDMYSDNAQGECTWVLAHKEALIKLEDPVDYHAHEAWPQDQEKTLVHELVHLHFAPFMLERDDPGYVAQEQAIELIAQALVSLKRAKK